MTSSTMNFNELVAIDTHVHLHGDTSGNPADEAARKYFGHTGPEPKPQELAAYYRSMKFGLFVVPVYERPPGDNQFPNDEVIALARKTADIMTPFPSVDPPRGREAVVEARRLITAGTRVFKLHPPIQRFHAND